MSSGWCQLLTFCVPANQYHFNHNLLTSRKERKRSDFTRLEIYPIAEIDVVRKRMR